jgi:hypothetical protein
VCSRRPTSTRSCRDGVCTCKSRWTREKRRKRRSGRGDRQVAGRRRMGDRGWGECCGGYTCKKIEVINYSKCNYKITLLNGWVRSSLYFISLIGDIKAPEKTSEIQISSHFCHCYSEMFYSVYQEHISVLFPDFHMNSVCPPLYPTFTFLHSCCRRNSRQEAKTALSSKLCNWSRHSTTSQKDIQTVLFNSHHHVHTSIQLQEKKSQVRSSQSRWPDPIKTKRGVSWSTSPSDVNSPSTGQHNCCVG